MTRIAFPLPILSTAGAAPAPRVWGCHSCGATLRRESCCQRAACWAFDDRGQQIDDRLDAPCDVPANHCAGCCPALALPVGAAPLMAVAA